MVDKYKWILDSREKNTRFLSMIDGKEDHLIKRITLSHFIHLEEGQSDLDCGDFTNENGDGIVEFKQFGDLIGSTTLTGVHHLEEQVIKMFTTGIPFAVIIYGNRKLFEDKSKVSGRVILSGIQKLMTLSAIYKFPAIHVKDESEALAIAKTFIRHCNELPRSMPVYNFLKKKEDTPKAMLCGIPGIGSVNADIILNKWKSILGVADRIQELLKYIGYEDGITEFSQFTPGLGPEHARYVIDAFKMEVLQKTKDDQA